MAAYLLGSWSQRGKCGLRNQRKDQKTKRGIVKSQWESMEDGEVGSGRKMNFFSGEKYCVLDAGSEVAVGRSGNQSSVSMEQSGQSPVLRCSTVAVLPQGHGAAGGGSRGGPQR